VACRCSLESARKVWITWSIRLIHAIAPGHAVVHEQEPGDSMFFILDGDFNVMKDRKIAKSLHKGDFSAKCPC